MDLIREAFQKVKQDTDLLSQEIDSLKTKLTEMNWALLRLWEEVRKLRLTSTQKPVFIQNIPKKEILLPSTHSSTIQTPSTHSSTHNALFKALKSQNLGISTGNEGVPTDRQTDRQTDRHIEKGPEIPLIKPIQIIPYLSSSQEQELKTDPIQNAAKILDSLDSLKKEIRLKFKRLTEQEILVFSTLYQLNEEAGFAEYKTLAQKLNLTESSIRDYIARLINKGIPVEKTKINNKTIQLKVADSLKKVASLATILKLRDL